MGVYFQSEERKRTPTANRSNSCSLRRNCLGFHFGLSTQIELKLVAAITFCPSSFMITFCELTLYTLHFYLFIQRDHPKQKIKAASIRKDHIIVKVKVKILYVILKILYKPVLFV